jgi:hypothetical protein
MPNSGPFPYDPALLAAARATPHTVEDVLATMRTIDATCVEGDGVKWFNWLYAQVTAAVKARVDSGGFSDPAWLAALDVQFGRLYFGALATSLSGGNAPGCWRVLFSDRGDVAVARIQFALSGINAHINHDLPLAIVNTCMATGTAPNRGVHYNDYSALNGTLDALVESAKTTLHVRLLGDKLPPISHLKNTIAGFGVAAAREAAWTRAETLWHLRAVPLLGPSLADRFLDSLDGLTTLAGKALLVPVPDVPF